MKVIRKLKQDEREAFATMLMALSRVMMGIAWVFTEDSDKIDTLLKHGNVDPKILEFIWNADGTRMLETFVILNASMSLMLDNFMAEAIYDESAFQLDPGPLGFWSYEDGERIWVDTTLDTQPN